MPVLAGEGSGFAEGAAEEEEEIGLVQNDPRNKQACIEGPLLRPILIVKNIRNDHVAISEYDSDHDDASMSHNARYPCLPGKMQKVDEGQNGGQEFDCLADWFFDPRFWRRHGKEGANHSHQREEAHGASDKRITTRQGCARIRATCDENCKPEQWINKRMNA